MTNKLPRGIRNNNPGNIETGSPWQGLATAAEKSLTQRSETRFAVFSAPKWGIRAIARVLITYQDKRKASDGSPIDTVREIIERWAPPFENDTAAYAGHVRTRLGLDDEEYPGEVDVHRFSHMKELVTAIIAHENGFNPYTDAEIEAGIVLAGVHPGVRSNGPDISASRTVKGVGVAATGGILTQVGEAVSAVQPAFPLASEIISALPWVAGGLLVAGLAWVIYARWDDKRRGLR